MAIYLNGRRLNMELFPNNESHIHGDEINEILVGSVTTNSEVVLKYETDMDLLRLMFVKRYLDEVGEKNSTLYITYMPYSRMDRKGESSTVFTLKYVSEFINSLNFSRVTVVEPHSDVTMALLNNVGAWYPTKHLLKNVTWSIQFSIENDYLFFPDAGAMKRYSKDITGYNTLFGVKSRDFGTGKIESLEIVGRKPDKPFKALIVDDLCSYGGTFTRSAEALRKFGANEVYLFVTHCEESIFKGGLLNSGLIDMVFTTNSLLGETQNKMIHQYDIIGGNK